MTFKGGPNAPHITDEVGTPLASDYTLSFTTAPAPQITTTFAKETDSGWQQALF